MQKILRSGNRVLISSSTNVYKNLALERFLAERIQHENEKRILLLWRNSPCVVIGRYQNPFVECDLNYLKEKKIDLARRYSGGGTCYHDLGNLNMTIFTTRHDYNRRKNLEWLVESLNKTFDLSLRRTDRDDVFLDEFKVTGSASRLERLYAYHHFTLLINANLNDLRGSLKSNDAPNFISKATTSVRSSVVNLSDRNSSIRFENLLDTLTNSFFQWNNPSAELGRIETIDPSMFDKDFETMENELKSEKFLFLSTPPFVYSMKNENVQLNVSNGLVTELKSNGTTANPNDFIGRKFHEIYPNLKKRFKQN